MNLVQAGNSERFGNKNNTIIELILLFDVNNFYIIQLRTFFYESEKKSRIVIFPGLSIWTDYGGE